MSNETETTLLRAALRHGVPEHGVNGLVGYIVSHIPTGDFLHAVLTNNLREACGCADAINRHFLFEYVSFLYNEAPSACWGSPEKVKAWLAARPEL